MTNLGPSGWSKDPPGPLLGCAYGDTSLESSAQALLISTQKE